jgi:hypothetical protein
MSIRVHELAKELGLTSKELLALAAAHGILADSHLASLSSDEVARLTVLAAESSPAAGRQTAATPAGESPSETPGETRGRIVRFDRITGKGEVAVDAGEAQRNVPFDLKRTKLNADQYVPMEPGLEVNVTFSADEMIDSIEQRPSY